MFLLLFSFFLHAEPIDVIYGVPPGYTKVEITHVKKTEITTILGTIAPPSLVINGKQVPLEETSEQRGKKGVFINGQPVPTQGKLGRFYFEMEGELLPGETEILVKGEKPYKLASKRLPNLFPKELNLTKYFKTSPERKKILVPFPLREGVFVKHEKQFLDRDGNNSVLVPIDLTRPVNKVSVRLIEGDLKAQQTLNYRVTKTTGEGGEFVALNCESSGDECGESFEVPFRKRALTGRAQLKDPLKFNGNEVTTEEGSGFSYLIDGGNCEGFPRQLQVEVGKKEKVIRQLTSSDCHRFLRKNRSRIYFRFSLFHWGVMTSLASKTATLFSDGLSFGPKLVLGVRLFDHYSIEWRSNTIGNFANSERNQWAHNLERHSLMFFTNYRKAWFYGLGVVTYRADFERHTQQFYEGFRGEWGASIQAEGGYRWYLSPSWALTSRIQLSPEFLSLQKESNRKWSFLMVEPLSLEYYF